MCLNRNSILLGKQISFRQTIVELVVAIVSLVFSPWFPQGSSSASWLIWQSNRDFSQNNTNAKQNALLILCTNGAIVLSYDMKYESYLYCFIQSIVVSTLYFPFWLSNSLIRDWINKLLKWLSTHTSCLSAVRLRETKWHFHLTDDFFWSWFTNIFFPFHFKYYINLVGFQMNRIRYSKFKFIS